MLLWSDTVHLHDNPIPVACLLVIAAAAVSDQRDLLRPSPGSTLHPKWDYAVFIETPYTPGFSLSLSLSLSRSLSFSLSETCTKHRIISCPGGAVCVFLADNTCTRTRTQTHINTHTFLSLVCLRNRDVHDDERRGKRWTRGYSDMR